jgi:sialidase-1
MSRVDVFRPRRHAVATRIPAIVRARDGALLAFAELRSTRADTGRIAIGARRSTDEGASWGAVIRVTDDAACARNPVPVVRADGRILLVSCLDPADAGTAGRPRGAVPTRVRAQHSDDGGMSWSEPHDISDQAREPDWRWYATGPGAVAPLASGRILIPANHAGRDRVHRAHTLHSDDGGESWSLGGRVDSPGSNEGQLAQRPDGRVLLYLRNRVPGGKEFAISDDEGASWHPGPAAPELAGPVCQCDIIAVGDELFATTHRRGARRIGLRVRRSRDGGETWPDAATIVRGASAYSDLTAMPDGRIGALFERGRRISFRVLRREDFRPARAC